MRPTLTVPHLAGSDLVGPVFETGSVANAVVAAIRQNNPDVRVEQRGSYLRVLAPDRCHLDRRVVEEVLGASFRLPGDLEAIMPSFKGRMTLTSEEAVWTSRQHKEAAP